ncbi:MAG: glycosyltransferase family 4 protein [bacterium]
MKRTFTHLLRHSAFDIIHCGHPALMSLFPQNCRVPIVLQQDSLHTSTILSQVGASDFIKKKHAGRREAKIIEYLKLAWRRADAVLVPTAANRDELRQYEPNVQVKVIPHGVDAKYYLKSRLLKSKKMIVLTGAMDRPANTNAALFFVHKIWPKLRDLDGEIRLFIVGRRPTPEIVRFNRLRNVHVTGEVIDIRPFLGSATVAVFPQQEKDGAGIKILEAMSMSIPVVCSPQACQGLDLVNKELMLVSETVSDFIENILQCIDDKNFNTTIGRAARAFVEKNNSWEAISQKLLKVYDDLIMRKMSDEDEIPSLPVTRVDFPEPQSDSPDKEKIFEPSELGDEKIKP